MRFSPNGFCGARVDGDQKLELARLSLHWLRQELGARGGFGSMNEEDPCDFEQGKDSVEKALTRFWVELRAYHSVQ